MALFSRSPQPAPVEAEVLGGEALVSLRNMEKSYAHGTSRTWVLRRITLDIKDGEFVSIMGPSGAGKSTLLHIVGMHDSAWTGEYYFAGQPVHRLGPKDRARLHKQHIGFVFQSYHLLDHLTVYENLDVPLSYRDIKKSERDSMVCDVLDRFNIVGKKDLYPNQLSGGQQQLVAVARAVIANPKVILADEPTGNLHSSQGREIMELFKRLNDAGTTIMQVTHSETNAAYGSRVIELKDGWVVRLMRVARLRRAGASLVRRVLQRRAAAEAVSAQGPDPRRQRRVQRELTIKHERHPGLHAGDDDDVSSVATKALLEGRKPGELITGTLEVSDAVRRLIDHHA